MNFKFIRRFSNLTNFPPISFSAGPAVLPKEVLKKAQANLVSYENCGLSVLELSHRSREYEYIHNRALINAKTLLNIPDNYKLLFMQGGATLQFSAIPLNICHENTKKETNYVQTGFWSKKAIDEAKNYCHTNVIDIHSHLTNDFTLLENINSEYLYYCDNETIDGIEFSTTPKVHNKNLICDMSSNLFSKSIDVSNYGIIFASAQKNFGPAGVTLVIIRDDLIDHAQKITPSMCNYNLIAKNNSLYNTPPCFSIYLCGLYFEYMIEKGGVNFFENESKKKSKLIYEIIDNSKQFYHALVGKDWRSRMNIPFRIHEKDEKLEKIFIEKAKEQGLLELKGHRAVGGIRASLYNGVSYNSTEKLAEFMIHFYNTHK